jgi:hypothetical protein
MDKGRLCLFIGAGLMLLSMPLAAFSFNERGTDIFYGYQVWYLSIYPLITSEVMEIDPIFNAMELCALVNLPQLVYPFLRSPNAGTWAVWVWAFSIIAFLVLPGLAMFFQLGDERIISIFREGYFVYQAGYIFSALGFWMKRRALPKEAMRAPTLFDTAHG